MPFELSVSSGYQTQTQVANYRDKLQATAFVRILVEYRW